MRNYKSENYIIICPSKYITGGTELLHQLCNELNLQNIKSFIYYDDGTKEIPDEFKIYKQISIINSINNINNSTIILPEVLFYKAKEFHQKNKIIFWWLSLDNYFYSNSNFYEMLKWSFFKSINHFIKHPIKNLKKYAISKNTSSIRSIKKYSDINLYQSEYCNNFLNKNNILNKLKLSDYINDEYISNYSYTENKSNIILYNPKKGIKKTNKIKKRLKNYEWIPLTNLKRIDMINMLKKSKLYIDLGNHPGKDRIPREAAIFDCCIITNREGSANYNEDVPIYEEFKIKTFNLRKIEIKINDIMNNYDQNISKFILYKNFIRNEKQSFINDLIKIFK